MSNIKLALMNIRMNLRNEKELKSTFIISIVGMMLNNIAFLFLWYYFGKTVGILNGWEAMDIFGLYGFNGIAYGIVMTFFYGITNLPMYISTGNLDKFLITPKNTLVKIATSKVSTSAIGDLFFGLICFVIFVIYTKMTLTSFLLSLVLFVVATIIFFSFVLISMSISFYLMEGEKVSESIYGLFLNNSLYHGGAFTGILRVIFIFFIPSLLVGSVQVETIKNVSNISLLFILLISIFWLFLSILFFYKSLKRYDSNNFFGFTS